MGDSTEVSEQDDSTPIAEPEDSAPVAEPDDGAPVAEPEDSAPVPQWEDDNYVAPDPGHDWEKKEAPPPDVVFGIPVPVHVQRPRPSTAGGHVETRVVTPRTIDGVKGVRR